jgi:hypothetical protein
MYAVMRSYSGKGAIKLFDVIEKNKAEVEKLVLPIKGFVGYTLVRTDSGGFSVTVCWDKAGIFVRLHQSSWKAQLSFT